MVSAIEFEAQVRSARATLSEAERFADALCKIREFLEPHPSRARGELRRRALVAVLETIGPSDPELARWYKEECGWP